MHRLLTHRFIAAVNTAGLHHLRVAEIMDGGTVGTERPCLQMDGYNLSIPHYPVYLHAS